MNYAAGYFDYEISSNDNYIISEYNVEYKENKILDINFLNKKIQYVSKQYNLSANTIFEIYEIINQTREIAEKDIRQFIKIKDNTIKALVDNGVDDLPMLEKIGHVRENILTEKEAKKLGYSIKNKHYHGLGFKNYLKIINSIDNPIAIYQYTNKGKYDSNNYIIITSIKNKKFIVPIEINQRGQYNQTRINYNKIKSVYSKNTDKYINNLIKKGKIKETFTGSDSQQRSRTDNIS